MEALKPLENSDSIFMIFTKKLTSNKFHELLNKVQEFASTLKDEDLIDNTLKELVVQKDHAGSGNSKQSVVLSYYPTTTQMPEIESPLHKASAVGSTQHIQSLHEEIENLTKKVKLDEEQFAKKRIQSYTPSENYDTHTHFTMNKPFAAEFATYENAPEDYRSPSNSTHQSFSQSPSPQSVFTNPFKPGSTNHPHSFLENSPTDKYTQDTPKFPNEHGLSAYVNKVWEEKANLQEMLDSEYPKPHHKQYPSFDTTFIPLQGPNFDLNSVKPGMVSPKLAEALGMKSEKDAPPYISKLSQIELPSYYRGETFYGINTPVPQDYNLESWKNAGIKPQFLPGAASQVNIFPPL